MIIDIFKAIKISESNLYKNIKHYADYYDIRHPHRHKTYNFNLINRIARFQSYTPFDIPGLKSFKNQEGELTIFLANHALFLIFIVNDEKYFIHFIEISRDMKDILFIPEYDENLRKENIHYGDTFKNLSERYKRKQEKDFESYKFMGSRHSGKAVWLNRNGEYNITDITGRKFTFKILSVDSKTSKMENKLERLALKIKTDLKDLVSYDVILDKEQVTLKVKRNEDKVFCLIVKGRQIISEFELGNFALSDGWISVFSRDGSISYRVKIVKENEIKLIQNIENQVSKPTEIEEWTLADLEKAERDAKLREAEIETARNRDYQGSEEEVKDLEEEDSEDYK